MNKTQFIGFDVHKKWIYFCAKAADGEVLEAGRMASRREVLEQWAKGRKEAWRGALEATLFSGWIYDELKPYAVELLVAHPAMMKAILASKKKNDRADAATIADLLRCNLLTKCYMAPEWMRELRRLLRYRSRVVRQAVQMKNRIAGVLMETGTPYEDRRLHGKRYFAQLVKSVSVSASVRQLLGLSRAGLEMFEAV